MDYGYEERFGKYFKNHKATVKQLDDETQLLTFKQDGTITYSVEFIFRKYMLFVGGDIGWGAFSCTWNPTWDYEWESTSAGYFAEKCKAVKDGMYIFSEQEAERQLRNHVIECFGYEGEELFEEVKELANDYCNDWYLVDEEEIFLEKDNEDDLLKQVYLLLSAVYSSSSSEEFRGTIESDDDYAPYLDYFQQEGFYYLGMELNDYFQLWLCALCMSKKQLLQQKKDEAVRTKKEEISKLQKQILEIDMKETKDHADYSLIESYKKQIEQLEKELA